MSEAGLVTAPPPMTVTFSEDYPGGGLRLVEPWWPGRLLIAGRLLDLVERGQARGVELVGSRLPFSLEPVTVRFTLTNASATYREIRPINNEQWRQDVYEFDCIACSRDLTDG